MKERKYFPRDLCTPLKQSQVRPSGWTYTRLEAKLTSKLLFSYALEVNSDNWMHNPVYLQTEQSSHIYSMQQLLAFVLWKRLEVAQKDQDREKSLRKSRTWPYLLK